MIQKLPSEERQSDLAKLAKPCPFCGKKLVAKTTESGHEFLGHGNRCTVAWAIYIYTKEDLEAWNIRHGESK